MRLSPVSLEYVHFTLDGVVRVQRLQSFTLMDILKKKKVLGFVHIVEIM